MSYASHSVVTAVIDKTQPFLFGMHKLLAERTKNLTAGQKKKPLIGSWSMLPGANLARMVASQGFDFILVDCEHGNIDDGEMHSLVAAIGNTPGASCSPMVRIAAPESYLVKRALDTGAHGLMCPLVSTAEEARRFVSYAKFPQRKAQRPPSDVARASKYAALPGVRGAGSPFAPALWKMEMRDYFDLANEGVFLAVQIETEEGLRNCEEIAKVEGVGESPRSSFTLRSLSPHSSESFHRPKRSGLLHGLPTNGTPQHPRSPRRNHTNPQSRTRRRKVRRHILHTARAGKPLPFPVVSRHS